MADAQRVIVVEALGYVGRKESGYGATHRPPLLATVRPKGEQDQPGRLLIDWPTSPDRRIYADAWLDLEELARAFELMTGGETRG